MDVVGPAGTGKTMMACEHAVKLLRENRIDRIVLTRPAVGVDENIGYLPGTKEEKMFPLLLPMYDVLHEFISPKEVRAMIEKQIIEVCPLSFIRGRTFKRAVVIGDEFQNTTPSQFKSFATRIGAGSKFVVTGDLQQHDRGFAVNGLADFLGRWELSGAPDAGLQIVRFEPCDVQRHPLIASLLEAYDD